MTKCHKIGPQTDFWGCSFKCKLFQSGVGWGGGGVSRGGRFKKYICTLKKKNPGAWGGGILCESPSMLEVWILLELHIFLYDFVIIERLECIILQVSPGY